MSSLRENIKRTTYAQVDGYRKWTVDAIVAPRADNCIYSYHPKAMGRPPMNNDQFREWFSTIIPLLKDFDQQVTIDHELYDEQTRCSVVHGFSTATTAIGPYRMEVVILMTFDEMGEKIVKISEMVDSAYMTDYLAKLTAHMESQAQPA